MAFTNPFKKKQKSKTQIDREEKEKVNQDRARTEEIKTKLEETRYTNYTGEIEPEDIAKFNVYFEQAIKMAEEASIVRFDASGIDKVILDTIALLKQAMEEQGSVETITRCFAGIVYGLQHGHKEIPSTAIETDIIERRTSMMKRYFSICQYSLEVDKLHIEVDRKRAERNKREEKYIESKDFLQRLIDEHPSIWKKVHVMTPDERTKLTGPDLEMAAAMRAATEKKKEVNHIELQIGSLKDDIVTVETAYNDLTIQLKNWESAIDTNSAAEMQRLTREFEEQELQQQANMKSIRESADELDKAISRLYAGQTAKERVVSITEEYDAMIKEEELMIEEDARGRQQLELEKQEKLKHQKELESMAKQTNTTSKRQLMH